MNAKGARWILTALLLGASAASLERFPSSAVSDEAIYAAFAKKWSSTGRFAAPGMLTPPGEAFRGGDAWHSRPHVAALAALSARDGEFGLGRARLAAFVVGLVAAAACALAAIAWGLDASWVALLLVANERFLFSSHVFRPEVAEVAAMGLLLAAIGFERRRGGSRAYWVLRGWASFLPVAAHASGLAGVAVNVGLLGRSAWLARKRGTIAPASMLTCFAAGTALALASFFVLQIAPAGGWSAAFAQLSDPIMNPYGAHSPGWMLLHELKGRWFAELFLVGGSWPGRVLRILTYSAFFAATFLGRGPARWLPWLTAAGYAFLVPDKIDGHFAEMVPAFVLALVACAATSASRLAPWLPRAAVVMQLALVVHHLALPMGAEPFAKETAERLIRENAVELVVGDERRWFDFHGRVPFCGADPFRLGHCPVEGKRVLLLEASALGEAAPLGRFAACARRSGGEHPVYDCAEARKFSAL